MSPTMWEYEFDEGTSWFFIESLEFSRVREAYFQDDENYAAVQSSLIQRPKAGEVMPGCDDVRKLRLPDERRGRGKRGGLRLIYMQIPEVRVIVLLDVYDKNEKDDLTASKKKVIRTFATEIKQELVDWFRRKSL